MKTTITAFSLAALLLAACGNDVADNTADTASDTSTATAATPPPATPAPDATAGMKAAMDKMMADLQGYQPTGDADHDFAAIMRTHHQGAIAMMQAYLPGAGDAMLRGMAEQGTAKQQGEVGELSAFLNSHQPTAQKSDYGKDATQMVVDMMKMDAQPQSADKAFAAMMIPHHESAVHIGQMFASQGKDAKMKEMAAKIAADQQKEAGELKQWLQAHP